MDNFNKRAGAITEAQKHTLTDFMTMHPELCSGRFTNDFTRRKAQELWETIATELNAMGGGSKDWKQWRRTWADMKRYVKWKASETKKYKRQTGGGSPAEELNDDENAILSTISPCVIDGHSVVETNISLNFEANNENNDFEVVEDNITEVEPINELDCEQMEFDDHTYTLTEPEVATPSVKKKIRSSLTGNRTTATRRHITALKLNQNLVNTITEKKDLMSEYYAKKAKFLEFKTEYYKDKILLIKQKNETQVKILNVLTQISNSVLERE